MGVLKRIISSIILCSTFSFGHFQVIMPSDDIVEQGDKLPLTIEYLFMHPFEQTYMNLEKPLKAGVVVDGKVTDLLSNLKEKKIDNNTIWTTQFLPTDVGSYIFFVEPKPYFEPSEEKFIKHLTKVVVDSFGADNGWDANLNLKAEIVPLTRPVGLYKGDLFQAKVLYKGKAVPNATVEVEYFNKNKVYKNPTGMHTTQVIKSDDNGIFSFVMPQSGWWGFAALLEDDEKIKYKNKEYPVELGAVFWVKTYDYSK